MIGKCTIDVALIEAPNGCMLRQRRMTFGGSLIASLPIAFDELRLI